jgi:predicted regulator of Ras-like GTPase activity (Roadblock/LC7/MglB family)
MSGNGIQAAMVVTADGELLGTSYRKQTDLHADRATLITDITLDYIRLGTELNQRNLQYLEMEMGLGTIGVASAGTECFVIALGEHTVPSGLLKARVLACASHLQESLIPVTDAA